MTHSRDVELREMLETRRRSVEAQMETASDDIDFALVQIQAETVQNIEAALKRLGAGDYGRCLDCDEEIPENRLRALPFATRCKACQETTERVEERARRSGPRDVAIRLIAASGLIDA
jgi:DnaK suppressor protein